MYPVSGRIFRFRLGPTPQTKEHPLPGEFEVWNDPAFEEDPKDDRRWMHEMSPEKETVLKTKNRTTTGGQF